MSNGEACCALGICCPPASEAQVAALSNELAHSTQWDKSTCDVVAQAITDNYDLMPKGSCESLKAAIAEVIKKHGDHA